MFGSLARVVSAMTEIALFTRSKERNNSPAQRLGARVRIGERTPSKRANAP